MTEFKVGELVVHVFSCSKPDQPVVFLHGLDGFAMDVWPALAAKYQDAVSLVTITIPLDQWSNLLAPWNTPAGWPQYVACTGGAPEYLKIFTGTIIPEAEKDLNQPSERILAGYSLAGLFAVWAMFETDLFDKIACASGSLWFPGFKDWFFSHQIKRMPKSIGFSASKDEFFSTDPYLSPVKETTEAIYHWFQEKNVPTELVLDPGNHYEDVIPRTKAAILWTLEH